MCDNDINFDDLEERPGRGVPVADQSNPQAHHAGPDSDECPNGYVDSKPFEFVERCKKCRGSGTFYSFNGRYLGECFACKGKGSKSFKTAPETRAQSRQSAADRKQRTAAEFDASPMGAYLTTCGWMSGPFARDMQDRGRKGTMTPNMIAAVERMMAKQIVRDAERAAKKAAAPTSTLDLTDLPAGRYAVPGGETRLKVLVRRPGNKWSGWTFVSDAAEYGQRTNYGRQAPGGLYTGKIENELTAIMADPHAASVAYGKLTGTCGVCGRHLEDEASVAAGIGPICAKRF